MYEYQFNNIPWKRLDHNTSVDDEGRILQISAFDIETTTIEDIERTFIYSWQVYLFERYYIYGRKIEHFIKLLDKLSEYFKDNEFKIFVHNLQYEFVFLYSYIKDHITDYFAKDTHNILYFKYKNITFSCSYNNTNMSLLKFLENEKVKHKKLSGYDYGKKRFYNSNIKRDEKIYARNDVVGLCEAIRHKIDYDKMTVWDMPLTSTGYVRGGLKEKITIWDIQYLQENYNSYYVYKRILDMQRGGDTHGNRYLKGKLLNVSRETSIKKPAFLCVDKISSYPFQIISKRYPLKKFEKADKLPGKNTPFICRIKLYDTYTDSLSPYISYSKCIDKKGVYCDNGRVVSAEYIEMDVIDIDYYIITNEYKFKKIEVSDIYISEYKKLPKFIIDYVLNLFEQKTDLKHGDQYFYKKVKNLINSVFGCMASRIVYEDYKLNDLGYFDANNRHEKNKYRNAKKKIRLPFIGAWITAYGRKELREVINLCGDKFIYSDTDSVVFYYDKKILSQIERINWRIKNFRSYTYKGQCMGVWDIDKYIKRFKFYGAKKYCYEGYDNDTHITVAGVPVRSYGVEIREGVTYASVDYTKKITIEDFKEGIIFKNANLKAVYTFNVNEDHSLYNGHVVYKLYSCLSLIPTDYTLSMSLSDKETILKEYKGG